MAKDARRFVIEQLEPRCLLAADPIISEFLADNDGILQDQDGDFSDWIELVNRGDQPIDLAGWYLTDDAGDLDKWQFPSKVLNPGEYLVVFASNKNRAIVGSQLHTNFALSDEGEFLALVRPDGVTIASAFSPTFPPQRGDVSYGLSTDVSESQELVNFGSAVQTFVPTNGILGTTWTNLGFIPDVAWQTGMLGAGYQTGDPPPPSITLLQIDFNDRSNPSATHPGFSPFTMMGAAEVQTDSVTRNYGPYSVTIVDASGGEGYQDRYRSGLPVNLGEFDESLLLTDFIFSNDRDSGGLDVTLGGLTPGAVYTVTLWSYDSVSGGTDRISDWTANGILAIENYAFRGGQDPTTNDRYRFAVVVEANAQGEIVLAGRKDPDLATDYSVFLNALKLETGDTVNTGPSSVLRVDFDHRTEGEGGSANTEPGYQQMTLDENGSTFGNTKITFLPFAGGVLGDRDRSAPNDAGAFTLNQVYDDHIFAMGAVGSGMDVVIEGLVPGVEYDVLLRSFDPDAGGVRSATWTEVSGQSPVVIASPYNFDGNIHPTNNDANTMRATLVSSAEGKLILRGVQNGSNRSVVLNALEISRASVDQLVQHDLLDEMYQQSASVYMRMPFNVIDAASIDQLLLDMRYDAGFVAYLNGQEVARRNAPTLSGVPPAYDASATLERTTPEAMTNETIDLSPFSGLLINGSNVLAIHGLNSSAADGDFLILPTLRGASALGESYRYFVSPTPGQANGEGVLGFVEPVVMSVPHGFYDVAFNVTLATPTGGASIYYTTNGSLPAPNNPAAQLYVGAIPVDTTTMLRAVGYKADYGESRSTTSTYIFLEEVLTQDPMNDPNAPTYPLVWQGNFTGDYAIDPRIVAQWNDNNPANTDFGIREALKSIPTMSIVMDHNDLWNVNTGIYPRATSEGSAWRRAGSIEYFDPNTGESFQYNVGVQMHGAASRDNNRLLKHSFRLIFNSEYDGPGRLNFPLFDNSDFADINTVVMRASFTDSFATRTQSGRYSPLDSTYTRDVFMRDSQIAMGYFAPDSTYVHLYINGLYWGLYSPAERTDDASLASHLGGEPEDWDIVKDFNELFRGNRDVYDQMFAIGNQIAAASASQANVLFQTLQGNHANGTPNPNGTAYLDVDSFIDYMILHNYAGVEDWPSHNWVAARNRVDPGKGFQFFTWDQEIALDGRFRDRTEANNAFSPAELFVDLRNSSEFRLRVADRVQKLLFNDGVLTVDANIERWMARADQIEAAIIGESARWGDAREGESINVPPQAIVPLMTVDIWRQSIAEVVGYFPQSHNLLISRFAADGLFPNIIAPQLNKYGGTVDPGFDLTMSSPSGGTIRYTLNGEDPRLLGGSVNPNAAIYSGAIEVGQTVTVKARTLVGSVWSPLSETTLVVGTGSQGIVISEINYHPHPPTAAEMAAVPGVVEDDFEFIEIMNTHPTQSINLLNMALANGLDYTFGNVTLAPGERAVVVEDIASFRARYGMSPRILGEWSGGVSNSGETIELRDALGGIVMAISYTDGNPWNEAPDGDGGTLELIDPVNTPADQLGKWYNWRTSTEFGGTPGSAGSGPIGVVINEVRTHATAPQLDAIELHNTTDQTIDISGWYLSDSGGNPLKFSIPAGTILAPGAYIVFDEEDFNPAIPGPGQDPFGLSAWEGDDVFLVIPDGMGGVASFVDSVHFGATFNGQSLGRVGAAGGRLAPLAQSSFGAANGVPLVDALVVTEIGYGLNQPIPGALAIDGTLTASELRFIELHNSSANAISLLNWSLAGDVSFSLSSLGTLAGGATVVVVPFNPAINPTKANAFRAHYGIGPAATLVGPFGGTLSELGARIELQAPDAPPSQAPGVIPRVLVDEVLYDNLAPWPAAAGGAGLSLQRATPTAFGNDPQAWRAEVPTPGTVSYAGSLAGDFSGDGTITLADLEMLVAAITIGHDSAAYDLNGDQALNSADVAYLVHEIVNPIAGDFNWDDVVDESDYLTWKQSYGSTLLLNSDANGDGVVNAADFLVWRNNIGATGGGALVVAGTTQPEADSPPAAMPAPTIIVSAEETTAAEPLVRGLSFLPATRGVLDGESEWLAEHPVATEGAGSAALALLLQMGWEAQDGVIGEWISDPLGIEAGTELVAADDLIAALDAGFADWDL